MSDQDETLSDLKGIVQKFCEDRDWDQFHGAKDLSIGIITESSELLELFRFKDKGQIDSILADKNGMDKVSNEVADILFFLVRFAQRYDIDLSEALEKKIKVNEERYPLEKSKGSNKKYSEF